MVEDEESKSKKKRANWVSVWAGDKKVFTSNTEKGVPIPWKRSQGSRRR
jgi:hypothetical protein